MMADHRWRWREWGLLLLCACLWAGAAPLPAAGAEGDRNLSIEIDIYSLLSAKDVLDAAAGDAIWEIKPTPGRRLLQIPLRVTPGTAEAILEATTLKIRGGRFLVYRISEDPEKAPKGSEAARQIEAALPDGPPLETRKITVEPTGKIRWSLDRSLAGFGGTLKPSKRLYAMKLNPALLGKAPEPPKRTAKGGGEDARAYQTRVQQEEAEYRARSTDFRELDRQVRKLPTDFEAPMPERIWAVFEIFPSARVEIGGPPPLPWSIGLEQLTALREGIEPVTPESAANEAVRLPKKVQSRIASMTGLMTDSHPYSARAVSFVLSESGLVKYAQPNDSLYKLIVSVLQSKDTTARQVTVRELARTVPPTVASLTLLKSAARGSDPSSQLLSLKSMLQTESKAEPAQVREMLNEANRLLAESSGPPPAQVVQMLLDAAAKQRETAAMLAGGVDFDSVPDSRRDAVIVSVVEKSPMEPLAAAWLDQKLLGSTNNAIVHRTLEVITTAAGDDKVVAPLARGLTSLVFGSAPTTRSAVPAANRAILVKPIPIISSNHAIFRAMQSSNAEIRGLAWAALPRFTLGGDSLPGMTATKPAELCRIILAAAQSQSPTPPQAVDVLARQKDADVVAEAMVQLVVRGSQDASRQATRAILGCKGAWPIGKVLQASPDERQAFAARIYENTTGKVPLLAGLLRQRVEPNPLLDWFTKELINGSVPSTSTWAAHAGGDDKLLELVTSSDPDLANGATSALVLSVGGDDRVVPALTQKLAQLSDTRLPSLQAQWAQARKEIYAFRLQQSGGSYQLVLTLRDAANAAPGATPAAPSAIVLGIIQVLADGQTIRLANQALTLSIPDSYAIRIDKVGELKNFNNEKIGRLPLELVTAPLDLLQHPDGSWHGVFDLPDGRRIELVMQPVSK